MTMLLLDSFSSSFLCYTFLQKRQLILSGLFLFMELAGKQRQGLFFFVTLMFAFIYLNRREEGQEIFHSVSGSADKKCQNLFMKSYF